jgi:hypothetical protein
MKSTFQKFMMVIVLTIVSFVGFGQADKASAAEIWRGGTTFVAHASNTGALYDYAFQIGTTDDTSVVNFSIWSYVPSATYPISAGPFYYDAFLMRWNGTSWVKDRWLNGNLVTYVNAWQQFTNVPKTGTPTLIWIDFYFANTREYMGHAVTPSFIR